MFFCPKNRRDKQKRGNMTQALVARLGFFWFHVLVMADCGLSLIHRENDGTLNNQPLNKQLGYHPKGTTIFPMTNESKYIIFFDDGDLLLKW